MGEKSGFVSIIGRPNAGKSTLLNRLVGDKVSIVTPKPQTTRHIVRGIATEARGQIVFLDTPGIHRPLHRMNERMMRLTQDSLEHVDVVVLILDVSVADGAGTDFAFDMVSKVSSRRFLVLNKIDRIAKRELLPMIDRYRQRVAFDAIIPVSALTGDGVDHLKDEIFDCLGPGPNYYPSDQHTDVHERFLAAEIIREKVILLTRQELPHATAIEIERFEEADGSFRLFASIYVERPSQKAIVIGRGGRMLERIGTEARKELQLVLTGPVYLELHVKVRRDWRNDERLLESLGM